ncbi:MAG TPA: hypothetical protein O0Y09_02695 [Methanocorpusculum sp.]|nr:hypothetical protein [Methanocorpusculum sp.]HJK05627.1 hypothetical protein [Methanocorpusculum sp.]HJK14579.1 hypothetical protein [Methanocorpusculum sp.]HJK17510.1 hypothetical protein [Methanocorpusculum sp.]HJK32092.1 hypothetical protein [Methanocorpusculum sp.]
MTGPRIYVCSGDCSVAFPESLDIPESITMCPEDLGFQECKSCTQMYVEEDMLHLEITETGLVAKKSCLFSFLAGSHKSFVPHTCTCTPAVSEPPEPKIEPETAITADQATIKEPKQTVSEPENQNVGVRGLESCIAAHCRRLRTRDGQHYCKDGMCGGKALDDRRFWCGVHREV